MSMSIPGLGLTRQAHGITGAKNVTPRTAAMSSLFDKIDAGGSGSITRPQFAQAFSQMKMPSQLGATNADTAFSALDTKRAGSVDKQEFIAGMLRLMAQGGATNAPSNGPSVQSFVGNRTSLDGLRL